MSTPALELTALHLGYVVRGELRTVVRDLSLALAPGEIGCLLGASGCGKSTVLRAVAGFEPVRGGTIRVQGECLASPGKSIPPERRRIGLMFQDYALFPHLDVSANVAFGLRDLAKEQRRQRVARMLELVGLPTSGSAYPHELSGGQQQRIALARALAPSPRLLLLDEPFSNLDAGTREHLAGEVRALLRETGTTALMVTHDQGEAFAMADSVGVMVDGRIRQWDRAEVLYRRPADRAVAAFVGRGSVLPAAALKLDGDGFVLLRPEQVVVDPSGPIPATVVMSRFVGPGHVCRLRLDGGELVDADLPAGPVPGPDARIAFRIADAGPVRLP
jgi:iron(III) transport system ATP-binding protein